MFGSHGQIFYCAVPVATKGSPSLTRSRCAAACSSGTRRSSTPLLRGSSGPDARSHPFRFRSWR